MTVLEVLGLLGTLLVMAIGVAGAVLPAVPGPPVILAAAVVHKLVFLDRSVSWWVLLILGLITLLSIALDFVASLVGAKKLGATWRGAMGAVLGGILGLFWLPLGLLIGPLMGAVLFELVGGRKWQDAGRAGFGAVLGVIAGAIGKLALSVAMVGLFLAAYTWLLLGWEDPHGLTAQASLSPTAPTEESMLVDAPEGEKFGAESTPSSTPTLQQ